MSQYEVAIAAGFEKCQKAPGCAKCNADGTRTVRLWMTPRDNVVAIRSLRFKTLLGGNSTGARVEYSNIDEAIQGESEWLQRE